VGIIHYKFIIPFDAQPNDTTWRIRNSQFSFMAECEELALTGAPFACGRQHFRIIQLGTYTKHTQIHPYPYSPSVPSVPPSTNPQSHQAARQHKGHIRNKTEASNRLPNKMYIWQPGRGHLKPKHKSRWDARRKRNL